MSVTIREAKPADMGRVVEMGRRFLLEGPYRESLEDNPQAAKEFGLNVMLPLGKILVADDEGILKGVFAFLISPHCLSGQLCATEFIWYVEPEFRQLTSFGAGISILLFDAAEKLAKQIAGGKVLMQVTAPTEAVGRFYLRRGYKQLEVAYQRSL